MKTQTFTISLLGAAMAVAVPQAQAAHPDSDNVRIRARVISASPIYRTINEPHKECWTESVDYRDHDYDSRYYRNNNNNNTGAIIGAIAGGLVGSSIGKGNGRVAAAAVGAATGAVVGSRWNNGGDRYHASPQQVERCRTTDHVRHVKDGYDVRYRFEGRDFHTQLPYHPGKWINLDANLKVARYQEDEANYNNRYRWDEDSRRHDDYRTRTRWQESHWND